MGCGSSTEKKSKTSPYEVNALATEPTRNANATKPGAGAVPVVERVDSSASPIRRLSPVTALELPGKDALAYSDSPHRAMESWSTANDDDDRESSGIASPAVHIEETVVLREIHKVLAGAESSIRGTAQAQRVLMVEELMCCPRDGSSFHAREELFLSLLQHPFELIQIRGDGNCPFLSTHVANLAAEALEAGAPVQDACEQLRESLDSYSDSFQAAEMMRLGALQVMTERPEEYYPEILKELRHAVSSTDADPTTLRIQALVGEAGPTAVPPPPGPARAALPALQLSTNLAAMTQAQVLQVYRQVMSEPGIFGERLELRALAQYCGRPIHLYYHTGWEQMLQCAAAFEAPPTEVFGPGLPGQPLHVFHLISGKHFHALVPRPASELPSSFHEGMTEEEQLQKALELSSAPLLLPGCAPPESDSLTPAKDPLSRSMDAPLEPISIVGSEPANKPLVQLEAQPSQGSGIKSEAAKAATPSPPVDSVLNVV